MAVTDRSVTSGTIAQHIQSVTHHPVSARTIRRRLQQSGLSARYPLLRLPLTQNHKRLSRQWCNERRMWTAEWKEIVFTESRFCLKHRDGRIRVWRHRGDRMLNSCVMHHHTGPAPGIMSKYLYFSVIFSDEASFHLSGIVNRHNVRVWRSGNPHEYHEAQRDSPKVNVWCGLMYDRVIGPFFFTEKTVSSVVYLDILENFVFPQLEELQPHVVLQQDGTPPHWGTIVRSSLNDHFTGRGIGRGGPIPWPPRSPDITPLDFSLWGFVKDNVYRRRVAIIDDLKARITTAIASVDADMLAGTWREIEYRLYILRATKGAHVEVH
ncbi:hypothetical protein X975_15209, partial [Stegodyphus mimosarum]